MGLITDTFAPETGAAGATGRTHDWSVSRRLVELSERPVLLAGGLTAENVRRAILEVRLAGVDVHTGVENAAGRKSRDKTRSIGRGTMPSGVAPRHYRGRTRHRVTPGSPLPGQKTLKRSSGFRADTSFRRHVRFTCAILPWRLRRAPMSLGSPSSEGRRW